MQPSFRSNGPALRRTVLALIVCAAALVAPRAEAHPNLDQVARQFEAVALGHEHGAAAGVVQKWNGDLRLALFSAPGWDVRPYLRAIRSEEHTSELQSLMRISYAVFCLKKKNRKHNSN